jgi:hypothetical protein
MSYRRFIAAETSAAAPLSRRNFLRCRVSEGRRVLELSCESLYMRYQDARSGASRQQALSHGEATSNRESPTGFALPSPDAIFAELERRLAEVDELRVREREWLDGGDFGRAVLARIEAFRQRGGRVELGPSPAATAAAGSRGPEP